MTYQTEPRMDIWRKELIWAWNQALWDAPSKVLADGEPDPQLLLTTQLAPELNGVSKELIMISAYFVPGQPGLVYLTGRADAGVSVRLLTNSLEATDVPAVHGGYAPYRKALLEHGVQLLSCAASLAKAAAALTCSTADPSRLGFQPAQQGDDLRPAESLHRLVQLRSALGAVEHRSRRAGGQPGAGGTRANWRCKAWRRPELQSETGKSQMVWVTEDNGKLHTLTSEPGSWWRRFNAWFSKAVGLERCL
jgi:putative cardiolipin synthase